MGISLSCPQEVINWMALQICSAIFPFTPKIIPFTLKTKKREIIVYHILIRQGHKTKTHKAKLNQLERGKRVMPGAWGEKIGGGGH